MAEYDASPPDRDAETSPPGRGAPSPPNREAASPPGREVASPPGREVASPPGREAASPPGRAVPSPPRGMASLMRSLSRSPVFRSAFREDAQKAVEAQGLDLGKLPREQLSVLAELSGEELETVISVVGRLREANAGRSVSL
jgi:hypothetical protein